MKQPPSPDLRYLFEPRSLAVIGASADERKIGHSILKNIIDGGFKGEIYPVNPRGGSILGLQAYPDIGEIPGVVDAASIAVPADLVFDAVKDCVRKDVKFGMIITSGFSEIGKTAEEREIVGYANSNGMRILGPNIFGLYSSVASLNATFGPGRISPGNVAIITQSGALGLAMIGKTAVENIGVSAIVSIGNKADVDESDLLQYLVAQTRTQIIMMYMEGVKKGERLIKILMDSTKKKPIVIIKSGRSERGAIAAASHTGSLAGSDKVFDNLMRQCGALRAESIEEGFNWCKYLANNPVPGGEETVIITNGGGIGVLAADACEKYSVKLFDDNMRLRETFSIATPDFGSTRNPVDITGQATSRDYDSAFNAALYDPHINSAIGLYCETAVFDAANLEHLVVETYESFLESRKPIVFSLFGGEGTEVTLRSLAKQGVPAYGDVYEAVSSLGAMYSYYRNIIERAGEMPADSMDMKGLSDMQSIISNVLKNDRNFLLAQEAHDLMSIAGIRMPQSATARNLDEATVLAERIGYPVVMKVVSRDIIHKSDAGGVALDLENRGEVIDAYQAIMRNSRANVPNAVIEGVEIAEMIKEGTEIIIGARRDRTFGPIVMVGLGGIYVEVLKDVSFRAFPLERQEIMNMIKEIRSYALLLGVRGEEPRDIDALIETIIKVGYVIINCREISDIEVNPLMVYEQGRGAMAVDARILLEKSEVR